MNGDGKTKSRLDSDVARACPGGRLAHPEGKNEEENEKSLRKSKKNWSKFEEKYEESGTLARPGLWGWLRPCVWKVMWKGCVKDWSLMNI